MLKKFYYNYFTVHYFGFFSGWDTIKVKTEEEAQKVKAKLEAAGFNVFIENITGCRESKEG